MREITDAEMQRLRGCEAAWQAVHTQLEQGNPDYGKGSGTGTACAVAEIKRLQRAARKLMQQTPRS